MGRYGALTYVAWRSHPQVGRLIKVGTTTYVYGRMIGLGARVIIAGLPYRLEQQLLDELAPWRVWAATDDPAGPQPLFHAPTEWFYPEDEALYVLREIVARSAA